MCDHFSLGKIDIFHHIAPHQKLKIRPRGILCVDKIGSRPREILCVDKIGSRPGGILAFAHFLFENRPMNTFTIVK